MPKISTILISYNHEHLLKKTIESYLKTISVPYELIIIDNASTDGSKNYIEQICTKNSYSKSIFLNENLGGEAINAGLNLARSPFLHVSENDLEYLPGWDQELLSKFDAFPKLGQLSLFSPYPQREKGEIWENHSYSKIVKKGGKTIYLTNENIGTSSVFRREVYDKGVRWNTKRTSHETSKFPADFRFSQSVMELGFWVAWNDKYTVFNWGHNIKEWNEHLEYYLENYRAKVQLGEKEMKKRLLQNGYDLINENGKYKIVKL